MATKRKDGRLQSSVTVTDFFTGEKKRIFVYGYTESEIVAEKKRVKEEFEKSNLCDAINPTLEDWYKEYLDAKKANGDINEVTYESYETKIIRHILPNLPKRIKVNEIQPYHIKHILSTITGQRTKNYVYTILNTMFKEALFERVIDSNPCSLVRKPKHKSKHANVMEPDHYQAMLEDVKDTQWEYLLTYAIYSGCRRSEISALRWSDIDFNNKAVYIKTAMKITKREGIHEGSTKSEYSVRKLFLVDEAIQALTTWRKVLRTQLFQQGLPWYEDSFVFRKLTDLSKPMSPDAITTKIGTLRRKLGLPDGICSHSFRHTYATSLAEENVDMKKIQLTIGHSSAGFTADVYVHNTPNLLNGISQANDAIAKKFAKAK